jgi:DNA-binding NtrC family response regulator
MGSADSKRLDARAAEPRAEGRAGKWCEAEVPMSAAVCKDRGVAQVAHSDLFSLYFGTAPASVSLLAEVRAYAATPYTILLVGPTGCGKTVVAELLHSLSGRSEGPFISCSLAAIPEDLRHAELSGSARGAYTGAASDRVGAIEVASGGTLFLDELGHASPGLQQMLLTILESGSVQRVGETRRRPVNTRFVLASSAGLRQLCAQGKMLEELLYRIEGFTISVPSLRERKDDIVPLAERFVAGAFLELHRPFATQLSTELCEFLRNATWPGNVRELSFALVRPDHHNCSDGGP